MRNPWNTRASSRTMWRNVMPCKTGKAVLLSKTALNMDSSSYRTMQHNVVPCYPHEREKAICCCVRQNIEYMEDMTVIKDHCHTDAHSALVTRTQPCVT